MITIKRVIRCTKFNFSRTKGFMSYYYFNVEFLNWWWSYRVVFRDPKGKDIITFSTTFSKFISAFASVVIYREH